MPAPGPAVPATLHERPRPGTDPAASNGHPPAGDSSAQVLRHRSAEELQDLLENATEAIHQVDGNGTILWANRAEMDLLGYAPHEYIGHNIAEFHADGDRLNAILERLKCGERLHDEPARMVAKDGSVRHVVIHSSARIVDGEFLYTRCFTRDVTEAVRRDAARRAFAELVTSLNDGFLFVDRAWRIQHAQMVAGPHRTPLEVTGQTLWEVFPMLAGTALEKAYRRAMDERVPVSEDFEFRSARSWWEVRSVPVDEGIWIYYRNITARRRAREHQAALARLGKEALVAPDLGAFLGDCAATVANALDAPLCKVLEYDGEAQVLHLRAGVGWKEGLVGSASVPAAYGSQAGYTIRQAAPVVVPDLASETRFTGPTLLLEHGVQSGMSVVIGGVAKPYGVLGVHARERREYSDDDVNFLQAVANIIAAAIARRSLEEHLEHLVDERTRRLAQANQELEAFNYSVSHDLRTPLRAISSYATLAAQRHGQGLSPEGRRMLETIHQEALRMGTLIEGLLNLARFHRLELQRTQVDVSALATEVLSGLAANRPERKVAWKVQGGLMVLADGRLLRAVLENLLGNAWKFTQRTADARIEVTGERRAGETVLCVRDNGEGFDMAYVDKLFQPFERLHDARDFEGTGIGLATVARIVGRHGGSVRAEGKVHGGAAFHVTLPDRRLNGAAMAPQGPATA